MLIECKTEPELRLRVTSFRCSSVNNSPQIWRFIYVYFSRPILFDHHTSKRVMNSRGLGIIQCPLNHDMSVVPSLSCASQAQFSFAILVNTHAVAHEIAVAPPTTGIADTASGKPFLRPASAHGISSPNYQGNSSRERTSLSLIPLTPSKDFKDQPPLLISSKPITNAALAPAALLTMS
jgi:hypothetical protein